MGYLEETLIFESNKIYFTDEAFGGDREVMMDWEDSLMSASAAYVCEGGGDILEIGFGMGISAGYIQSHSISSHTIVENHPQIITKAQAWASDKSNVNIVTGSWYDNLNNFLVTEWDRLQNTNDTQDQFDDNEQHMIIQDAMNLLLDKLNVDSDDFEDHEQDVDWMKFDDIIGYYLCYV